MADDTATTETVELTQRTGSPDTPESVVMETAPECSGSSQDVSEVLKTDDSTTDSREKHPDPFAASSDQIVKTPSEFGGIHQMLETDDPIPGDLDLDDGGPPVLLAQSRQDAFTPAQLPSIQGNDYEGIHNLQSLEYEYVSDSATEDEIDAPLLKDEEAPVSEIPCRFCEAKIKSMSKEKNLSRHVFIPCKFCKVSPADNLLLEQETSLQAKRKQSLNKQLKEAFRTSDSWKMNNALMNFRKECGTGNAADLMYDSTLQRLLYDAILCGKQEISQVLITHAGSRIFLAKDDLKVDEVSRDSAAQLNTATGAVEVKTVPCTPKESETGGKGQTVVDMFKGQTSLHLAVSQCDSRIVSLILDRLNESDAINLINKHATGSFFTDPTKVPEGQFCLFLAAWLGCVDIFELLIHRGAALDMQDTTGNTILHKLVQLSLKKTETEVTENELRWLKTAETMCEFVLQNTRDWWGRLVGGRRRHQETKEAIIYLLSIKNNNGFTPLGLAASLGAARIFDIIVNSSAYRTTHFNYEPITDVSYRMNEIDSALCGNDGTSCLELIIYNPIDKACEFVNLQPISALIQDKWNHYRKFYYIWALTYVAYMLVFSVYMFIRPTHVKTIHDLYFRPVDKFRAFLEVIMVLGIPWYLYGELQDLSYPGHRRCPDPWKYVQDGLYRIIRMLFVTSLVAWAFIHFTVPEYEDIILSLCLFFGWIYVIIFTCGSDSFGIFPVMLQRMVFLDLLRFLVVFLIIIISMSMAMYCVFQATPHVQDYSSIFYTSYSLFKMTLGLQDVGNLTEARHPGIAVFLFILYAVLGNILLLNVLIAMMNESYSSISEKAPVFRLETLQRVYNTLMIERRLPQRFSTAQNYKRNGKSDKYIVQTVVRLGQEGMVKEDDFSINVQKVDYMSTIDRDKTPVPRRGTFDVYSRERFYTG